MKIYFCLFIIYSIEVTVLSYNVRKIVRELHQQFCTIVEVGEGFCSLFVEFRPNLQEPSLSGENVAELFLGLCPCHTLNLWQYCNNQLFAARPDDCQFDLSAVYNTNARVHRRLCDLSAMQMWNSQCNCSNEFAGELLYPVIGFNTCVRSPLPDSICKPRNVCGINKCSTKTLFGAHLVRCDPNCKGKQPFCEDDTLATSQYRTVNSVWSPWTRTVFNSSSKYLESESVCVDLITKAPAFDCLGPGMFCCPQSIANCKCEVTVGDAVMKVRRSVSADSDQLYRFLPTDSILYWIFKGQLNRLKANFSDLDSPSYILNHFFNRKSRNIRNIKSSINDYGFIYDKNQSKNGFVKKRPSSHNLKQYYFRGKDKLATVNYSSCWETTIEYRNMSKGYACHSNDNKQNSEDEDPWKSGLLLEQEDLLYFKNFNSKLAHNSNTQPNTVKNPLRRSDEVLRKNDSTAFNIARNISSLISNVLATLHIIQPTESTKEAMIHVPFTDGNFGSYRKKALLLTTPSALVNKYGNVHYLPVPNKSKDFISREQYNMVHNRKESILKPNYRNQILPSDTQRQSTPNMFSVVSPSGQQIVEIDVNKLTDLYKNNVADNHNNYLNSKHNGTLHLHSGMRIENNNFTNDNNLSFNGSFILPIDLNVINISSNSENKYFNKYIY